MKRAAAQVYSSLLNGLQLRAVAGRETNQANVSGFGLFVDYDLSF